MADDEAAEHRRNIERYRYLLAFLRDPEMRMRLEQLLKEAMARLTELDRKARS